MTARKTVIAIIIIAAVGIGAFAFFGSGKQSADVPASQYRASMLLTSPSFENNGFIPAKFTCDGSASLAADGGDINPELHIQNAPDGAKSLALVMHDPDAPRAGGFTHWLVWNIDPKTAVIKQESRPPGLSAETAAKAGSIEGKTDFGRVGYGGPCPPSGTHRYFFKLYALDIALDLAEGSGKKELEEAMKNHVIAETELVGLYKRK